MALRCVGLDCVGISTHYRRLDRDRFGGWVDNLRYGEFVGRTGDNDAVIDGYHIID